jgi:hypothetical protein
MHDARLPGYEFVEEIARQVIAHSLDEPLYEQPIGALTFKMVSAALFNPLNLERDCALTGRLYPMDVSRKLSEKGRLGYTAPWFMQSEFLVSGELEGLKVRIFFLAPKAVTDLVSSTITALQKAEMVVEHQAYESTKQEEKPITVTNKEGKPLISLSAKLHSTIRREGGLYRVTIRLENVSKVRSVNEAAKKISYRSAHAFYAPFIVVEARGNINHIITQDDPYVDRKTLMNCNCFTRRSKKGSKIVFASPLIIVDRPVKKPVLAESSESTAGMDPEMIEVLRVTRRREVIERLYKHQFDSLRIFSDQLSGNLRSKCIVSVVPTAFGKTLTACTMALYSALKGRESGTKALLLFPTRVLTIQQLTALAKYVYDINASGGRRGRRITLGLYIGRGHWEENAYAPFQLITECPACGEGPLTQHELNGIAYPRCSRCGSVLDYIFLDDRDTQRFCPDIVVATPDKLAYELQRDPMSHVLVGAPMHVCGACGRANPALGGQQACAGCGSSLAGMQTCRSDIRFVFVDEFTLLSGMPSSRLSHFMRLLRRLKQTYGLNDDIIFFLACATVANPEEFGSKFTGVNAGDVVLLRAEDYFFEERRPWQRVIVLYPWDLSTLGSVAWGCLTILRALEGASNDQLQDYGKQLVYVQRRDDGHNLYDYIRRLGGEIGVRIGEDEVFFFHGDLRADELASEKGKAQRAEKGILIGTSTLGWGVHMPWLNVAHVWGAPNSTSEFFQVIGRVGREVGRPQEKPALVVLHLYPGNPRDVWLYDNFISWFSDPSFEPEVIDPYNISVVRSIIPACFVSLLISRLYTKYYSSYDPRSPARRSQTIMQCLRSNDAIEVAGEAMDWIFLRGFDVVGSAGERLKHSFITALLDYIQTARSRLSFRSLTEAFPEVTEFSLRGGEASVGYFASGPLLEMLPRLKGQTVEEESLEEVGLEAGTQEGGGNE